VRNSQFDSHFANHPRREVAQAILGAWRLQAGEPLDPLAQLATAASPDLVSLGVTEAAQAISANQRNLNPLAMVDFPALAHCSASQTHPIPHNSNIL
jgi:hypothetical protein